MTHPNERLTRDAYDAFRARDLEKMDRLLADDVTWNVGGDTAISGTYEGKQAVMGFLRRLGEETGGTFRLDVHDVLANDDHAVALVHARAERGGDTLDDNVVHVMHVDDGRVTSFWSYPWDQAAGREFWG